MRPNVTTLSATSIARWSADWSLRTIRNPGISSRSASTSREGHGVEYQRPAARRGAAAHQATGDPPGFMRLRGALSRHRQIAGEVGHQPEQSLDDRQLCPVLQLVLLRAEQQLEAAHRLAVG